MMLKIVKVIGIKLVYILFFAALLLFISISFLNVFNRYFFSFGLSEEVNRYLESVSLEQIKSDEADRIINVFHPTGTPVILPEDLSDPFAPLEPEAEE